MKASFDEQLEKLKEAQAETQNQVQQAVTQIGNLETGFSRSVDALAKQQSEMQTQRLPAIADIQSPISPVLPARNRRISD